MKVTGYAYPWDVLEDGFAARAHALGVDEVAVALSYHSARAATPWSASRTAVVARHAAFHRPVRPDVWGSLRPSTPDWIASGDSGGDAVRLLNAAGIPASFSSRTASPPESDDDTQSGVDGRSAPHPPDTGR